MDLFSLKGETAVVIGATGVLGGSMAEALASAGATVAVCGRSKERGEACVARIAKSGGSAFFVEVDAVSKPSLAAARGEIEKLSGAAGVLVNAAGGNDPNAIVTADQPVEALTPEAWRENFDLNLVGGALLPCQEFGPAMKLRGDGSIINIASISAHIPLSRVIAYSAAKAAVLNLTKFLAREWAAANVRVNSITPGVFPAEQNRKLLFNEDGSPTERTRAFFNHTPMARFGEPHELWGALLFLASSKASGFVTGTDIRVDGGFLSQTI
jgi:NAD(P)-dependent dehydrogenase (short-subunit alcohol dehydrogenase family)